MEMIKVGITHGDMNGIGYEVILKALSDSRMFEKNIFVIYGYSKAVAFYKKSLGIEDSAINVVKSPAEALPKRINIVNCSDKELKVEMGVATQEAGAAAFYALERATADLKDKQIQVLVTAPINKKTIQSDKFQFQGHTEYLATRFDAHDSLMFFVSDKVRIALVTNHLPVASVAQAITKEAIVSKLEMLKQSLQKDFLIHSPRIAVLALNPHAGDGGVIGSEDADVVTPAIKEAQQKHIICMGPFPADGFFGSGAYASYDAVLAMYHDQALAPFKVMCMDEGVNFTAGLPIVRTSPTHGTAYDKVGKQCANESSLRQAIYLAVDVYNNRKLYAEMHANPLVVKSKK